jgi:DNA-binding MarR family transcriptional regulator
MELTAEVVCQDLLSLLSRFKQEMGSIADERGLTPVQLAALYRIDEHGELAMGKVAHVLHCDPSNVTGIVDRLVVHNLVTRKECATDRRAKTIALTPEGQKVVKQIMEIMPERLGCAKFTQAEREAIHSAVQKVGS